MTKRATQTEKRGSDRFIDRFRGLLADKQRRRMAGCLFAAYLVAAAAFFFMPVAFTPDSGDYLSGALGLLDGSGIAAISGFRGPMIPALLAVFFALFGRTVTAVKLCWFLMYSILFFSAFSLLKTLGLFKDKRGWFTWPLFIFALLLNPCVMAYGHLCLTELPALACLTAYAAVLAPFYRRDRMDSAIVLALKKLGTVCLFTVLVYMIKQAAFPIVPLLFLFCEALALGRKFCFKQLCAAVLTVALAAGSLLGYMGIWGSAMQGKNIEGDSVSAFAGTFLVDGLRYFRVTERATYDKPVVIEVMRDDYEAVQETFEYTFDNTMGNTQQYWFTCLRISPQKVVRGYAQNYLLVTGTRHLLGATGMSRAYAKVNATTEFFTGQETAAWTDAFAHIDSSKPGGMSVTNGSLEGGVINEGRYNNSAARKLLLNSYYRKAAYFQYGFITYHALLIAVLSAVGMWISKRRGADARVHRINFVCAGTIFSEILFLAVTAQGIDRYGFPLTILCFLIVVNTISACGGWLLRRRKSKQ